MKVRNTQFDLRKNPDSPRVHGLRRAVDSSSADVQRVRESVERNGAFSSLSAKLRTFELPRTDAHVAKRDYINAKAFSPGSRSAEEKEGQSYTMKKLASVATSEARSAHKHWREERVDQRRDGQAIPGAGHEQIRSRGKWRVSPLWEAKLLLGVLREQGLAGKGLVEAFEKWVPRVTGCSRSGINRVYCEQTGRELSDYILVQQADKTVRYNQLPPEAEIVRAVVQTPDAMCYGQPSVSQKVPQENEGLLVARQTVLDKQDPNVLLSTDEVASLTGFRPKTIRRWVSRKLLNYIRVGNRLRFRLSAVELFLAQREVRK
jgi:excisionase family DNA binding protein